jgi:hypothetical protein
MKVLAPLILSTLLLLSPTNTKAQIPLAVSCDTLCFVPVVLPQPGTTLVCKWQHQTDEEKNYWMNLWRQGKLNLGTTVQVTSLNNGKHLPCGSQSGPNGRIINFTEVHGFAVAPINATSLGGDPAAIAVGPVHVDGSHAQIFPDR